LCNSFIIIGYFDYTNETKMENFVQKVKNYNLYGWFKNQTASWNTHFAPEFIEILTNQGFGSAFNIMPESKLLTDL
jgi:hypothetical protein